MMKTSSFFYLAGLALATSCGEDAASKKAAADTEARVVATIQQLLVNTGDQATATGARTWYQSAVPNIIKLDPHAASVYQDHAALLKEVATTQPKLVQQPILSADQAQGIRRKYEQLVQESTANVEELTTLATSKTTMSEAEQRQFVASLATKENHQLQLVRYYGKRTAATIDLKTRKKKQEDYDLKTYGHY